MEFYALMIWLTLMWLCNRIYWLTATIASCKWDTKEEAKQAMKTWKIFK